MPCRPAALTLAASLFMAMTALPASTQSADCNTALTQNAMTRCAEQAWMAADGDLNAAYREARDAMRRIDARLDGPDKGAETSLREAQRAWIAFRDATCAAEGWAMKGGSAEPMLVYFCRARVTEARAAELRAMSVDF